ncbi:MULTISPECIES: hydrogen gas-evolving membrane-bound hydrogenase subunit E [Thermococcus]|uniref:Membrane bound [NiFe]-hydrogenase MBH2, subunit Mbh2E (Na+/H+ antiporter module subunit) n=2 Tax=Thermococcus barophilus TaxID=55802 RepID=A0A0S1XD06_THEBA|nr:MULTISPECIES: hydrogen gas-evolving membrane-bound hydrogenase subunit E [Thermococcus]ADT84469.1 membrane bound hydrogenase MbhE-like subunit [Thermococcus barophilus MP]ALM75654.1 Membrane bound [NiFe]-hydrogenase MBH2, subunit Mbh2E (Na+/H+ antiporter module subunit) [Thermococcus barophilus]WRS53574.1 hydrogen gas-evolving membrane-bound hydrogenase subunit E [Thermococcus sp. SY098]
MNRTFGALALLFILGVLLIVANPQYGLKFGLGGSDWQKYRYTDQYYIEHGVEEVGGTNIVTDIVFDYRGYDTLGEATVLFTAIAGAVALLRPWRRDEDGE